MRVLFLTIGQRDIQQIYYKGNDCFRSPIFSIDKIGNNFDYFDIEYEIPERKIEKREEFKIEGYIFPILEKILRYHKKINRKITKLYLLVTDRNPYLKEYEAISSFLIEKDFSTSHNLLEEFMGRNKKDKSLFTANLILDVFNSKKSWKEIVGNIEIINILKDAKYLKKITYDNFSKLNNDDNIAKILKKTDINKAEFFYPQIHKNIAHLYSEISDKKISLALSGGIPLLNKALEHILRSMVFSNGLIILNSPENDNLEINPLPETKTYADYFEIYKRFKKAILCFYYPEAFHCFEELKEFIADKPNYNSLEKKMNSFRNGNNKYELQFSLLLSALYRDDLLTAIIYLKVLQEQTIVNLLKNLCKTNKNVKWIDFNGNNDGEKIEIDGEKYSLFKNEMFLTK